MKHGIPEAALDKHIAFLGATGSGKTSSAKTGVVEPALAAGERVVIIDPTGAWWGLRIARDGKGKGLSIYIFGGDHGDYPLRARDARVLAEAFATSTDSAIFDTSLMTVAERTEFFTEFAEALRRKNKGPLKVVIDEAHLFMPQLGAKAGGTAPAMLHAGNNLVSLGRSRGLRITLISQRPAKLHKDSLTQVQSLVAMRLLAPQDRDAIKDWIADQADPGKGKAIIASLPGLKPGDAWVWSPLDDYLERVHFSLPLTFDSSRAPTRSDGEGPRLTPINLDALREKLATVEAETKANDPKALRAEITRLNAQVRRLNEEHESTPEIDPVQLVSVRREGYQAGYSDGWEDLARRMPVMAAECLQSVLSGESDPPRITREIDRVAISLADGADAMERATGRRPVGMDLGSRVAETIDLPGTTTAREAIRNHRVELVRQRQRRAAERPSGNGGDPSIGGGLRRMMIALAQRPQGLTQRQLGLRAGLSSRSGTFSTYLSRGRTNGWLEGSGALTITREGLAAIGEWTPLPEGRELAEHWLKELGGGAQRILRVLLDAYPDALDPEAIGARAQISHRSGTYSTYVSKLRTLELIEGRGHLKASDEFFR